MAVIKIKHQLISTDNLEYICYHYDSDFQSEPYGLRIKTIYGNDYLFRFASNEERYQIYLKFVKAMDKDQVKQNESDNHAPPVNQRMSIETGDYVTPPANAKPNNTNF